MQLVAFVGEAGSRHHGGTWYLLRQLLKSQNLSARQVIAIGMGVPGPVDFDSGQQRAK